MALLLPEPLDDDGAEPELKPLELELLELPVELELLELFEEPAELVDELDLLELVELLELLDEVPVDDFDVLADEFDEAAAWVEPGKTTATAPAVTTLARPTAEVAVRTLLRPRRLAVTAWAIRSRCALLMRSVWGRAFEAP